MEAIANNKKKGFVVFVAILTTTIILSIGLGVLDLTLREFQLSVINKESARALYAADAGIECAFHYDLGDPSNFNRTSFGSPAIVPGLPVGVAISGGTFGILSTVWGIGELPDTIVCGGTTMDLELENLGGSGGIGDPIIYETRFVDPAGFIIQDDGNESCAYITVQKLLENGIETTIIESRGSNILDCSSPGFRVVQRALRLRWSSI